MHCIDRTDRRAALGVMAALAAASTALLSGCGSLPALPSLPGRSAPPPPPAAPTRPPAAALPSPAPQAQAVPSAAPAPAAAAAAPTAPSGRLAPLGPATALPPAAPARSWNDFKKAAATRMVQASPRGSYTGKVPALLFGIPILEIELAADGQVRDVHVLRPPANAEAADTVALAVEAIRRGAPYGDVSRLPRPWKWTEVFLFDNDRRFKPRSLD